MGTKKEVNKSIAGYENDGWTLLDEQMSTVAGATYGPQNWTGLDGERDYMYKITAHTYVAGTTHQAGLELNGISDSSYHYVVTILNNDGASAVEGLSDTDGFQLSRTQNGGDAAFWEMYVQGRANAGGLLVSCRSFMNNTVGGYEVVQMTGSVDTTDPLSQFEFFQKTGFAGYFDNDCLWRLWAARPKG